MFNSVSESRTKDSISKSDPPKIRSGSEPTRSRHYPDKIRSGSLLYKHSIGNILYP